VLTASVGRRGEGGTGIIIQEKPSSSSSPPRRSLSHPPQTHRFGSVRYNNIIIEIYEAVAAEFSRLDPYQEAYIRI